MSYVVVCSPTPRVDRITAVITSPFVTAPHTVLSHYAPLSALVTVLISCINSPLVHWLCRSVPSLSRLPGIDSAVRRRYKGAMLMPKIGYGTNKLSTATSSPAASSSSVYRTCASSSCC